MQRWQNLCHADPLRPILLCMCGKYLLGFSLSLPRPRCRTWDLQAIDLLIGRVYCKILQSKILAMTGSVVSQIDAILGRLAVYSAVLLFGLQVLYWCTEKQGQVILLRNTKQNPC